ncbi:bifunctional histidinol-phosphatase/imidazoleglycerol-phosphate dehydratase HisB [Tenuifilum thalassicum]|uniref:Histidine biosynthesis bifunctional protein HisB n=1 Tax=Tenuifilum thalassicum TaxID=2590900 RepID=A0A7D3XVR2_9BACT|nr:bifunctional histidinol-phosphatase/imidazoleglycerol-phosphate dehydratase HisB [Tenuifilum thalassicum]QKG80048.1 bifunctional histidinol-phosphatase/imidazoleglycerol-phosphate dehydratase HisB [Tenuifilum thalassicum]
MKPILFIDRDGTLIKEPNDQQVDSFDKLEFMPGVFTWLGKVCRELNFYLVMVTNQDGLGTKSFPESDFWGPHNILLKALKAEGITFDEILIDRSLPGENKPTRKPGTGLVKHLLIPDFDIQNSFVIGDRETDERFAQNIGCKAIRFGSKSAFEQNLSASNWEQVFYLLKPKRVARLARKTTETDIAISISLDGDGIFRIDTGIHFFNHMLEQLSKHSGIDMDITCKGDLNVDEHHTIEDVGIALGEALKLAIGDKKGINRYGFDIPMDESLARVAIDFSGRPYLVFNGDFKREYLGGMPTEMIKHFFHSLAYSGGLTINIEFNGENDHHKTEAIFKAFARSLKQAICQDGNNLPSTKGKL